MVAAPARSNSPPCTQLGPGFHAATPALARSSTLTVGLPINICALPNRLTMSGLRATPGARKPDHPPVVAGELLGQTTACRDPSICQAPRQIIQTHTGHMPIKGHRARLAPVACLPRCAIAPRPHKPPKPHNVLPARVLPYPGLTLPYPRHST